jgi:hypothetical protein
MQAFQARSIGDVGGEVCKSFTSVVYPNSNFFDKLIQPDSPVQYTGWFSEDTFTTTTIPATSHYKVYYHIYSGNDQGGYYTVYLKDLPVSNYIYSNQMYIVDRGYITKGSQVDQAKDFTAVSGYKQLCISINGKDECGFGKVTSSYFLNSLTDTYAQQQIQSNIKSSSECVAGTASLISLAQPNLQAGAEQILNPQLYNSGIIRVCATYNPGKQVLPNGQYDTTNSTFDRWKDVGYCDDPTIRCWIDTQSVKNVIADKSILNQTLNSINLNSLGQVDYWTEAQSMAVASEGKQFIDSLQVTKDDVKYVIDNKISAMAQKLISLTNLGTTNQYRARGLYLLGRLYRKVAESLIDATNSIYAPATVNPNPAAVNPNPVNDIPINPATPVSTTNSDIDRWNNFYDNSDQENLKLKVYNISDKTESQIGILYLDSATGDVGLISGGVMTAVIQTINGRNVVVLKEQGAAVTPVSGSSIVWTDSMLKKDVQIRVVYNPVGLIASGELTLSSKEINYMYRSSKNEWVTPDKNFKLNLGYVDGIKSIVGKLSIGDEVYVGDSKTPTVKAVLFSGDNVLIDEICDKLKK